MFRRLLLMSAAAAVVLAQGATAASAGWHGHAGPSAPSFRYMPAPHAMSPFAHGETNRMPPVSGVIRVHGGGYGSEQHWGGGVGGAYAGNPYGGTHQMEAAPAYGQYGPAYGHYRYEQSGQGYAGQHSAYRLASAGYGYGYGQGYGSGQRYAYGQPGTYRYGYGQQVSAGGGVRYAAPYGGYRTGGQALTIRHAGYRYAPSYATSGYGYGSTGYGYGGDFSTAYTTDYDQNQTVGYDAGDGTYGGQGYGVQGYGGQTAGDYGYGGQGGFSPQIPPAGGLAVYSAGAYGPGPRIVTIPTHYAPGANSLGCTCSSAGY